MNLLGISFPEGPLSFFPSPGISRIGIGALQLRTWVLEEMPTLGKACLDLASWPWAGKQKFRSSSSSPFVVLVSLSSHGNP